MGTSVVSEIGTLMRDHPYVSCSLLIFLTPPFFPILKFFSPLLISTALFVVALVTMGPQFEGPSIEQGELQDSLTGIDAGDEAGSDGIDVGSRDVRRRKSGSGVQFSPNDWIKSCKESGLAWVEEKLFRNDSGRGTSLNDENVSILQEAFAHRAEEKPCAMVKLVTRRIPAEEEERVSEAHSFRRQDVPELSNSSNSWKSSHSPDRRSFERPPSFSFNVGTSTGSRDLAHDLFSPHPSLSRRRDSELPLFDNVGPPPIEYDMPPLVTGPASITAPLFRSFEDDMDSDDEYGHHHSDHDEHMHLEVGERSVDAESSLSQDELPVAIGTYDQPPPFTVQEEDLPSSSDSDEERSYFADWHQGNRATESSFPPMHDEVHSHDAELLHKQQPVGALGSHDDSSPLSKDVSGEHSPLASDVLGEQQFVPAPKIDQDSHLPPTAGHEESLQLNNKDIEVHNIPELEDDVPVEEESLEPPVTVGESSTWREFVAGAMHGDQIVADLEPGDVPASHGNPDVLEVPPDQSIDSKEIHNEPEVPAGPKEAPVEALHSVERSLSLPVLGSLATAGAVELVTAHEDLAQVDESVTDDGQEQARQAYTLGGAISLPAGRNSMQPIIIPPMSVDPGPLSPDTDLGYATTPDQERRGVAARFFSNERYNSISTLSADESELGLPAKQLSAREKLTILEDLCNSMPSPASGEKRCPPADQVAILRATTDEQVNHVTDKLKDYIEDSPSKRFQPDAPQLQITPPSTKIVLNATPSKSAILASALGRPSIRPAGSSSRTYGGARYSSSEESSEDEQIDLDSDVEVEGTDSDSDFEIVERNGKSRLKPPPKPPAKIREPQPVVQGKQNL